MAAAGNRGFEFARVIEQAGADALELNLYEVATQLNASSVAIEERIVNIVRDLKALINDPHRCQALSILHSAWQPGCATRRRRCGRAGAVQPVLSA